MDVEILIHGVPDGQKYYGTKEEQATMGLFYDNSTESVKFVVETKKQGSTAFAYYSYLRYKGMIEAGGRLGSYFGLTLRLDKYYQDAIHIYNLLEIVFNRYIVGSLLTPSGEAYKYTVADFASKASDIAQMQQALIQLIQTTCTSSKFMDIDASFIHPIAAVPSANIADVSNAAILASIKKYSKVVLSPEYELNIEKEYKKKLQDAEGKGGSIVAEKDRKIAEKDSTITSLNTKVTSQQNKITVLEQESKRKDTEIQQLKQKGDLTQQVAKIKEPIIAIAEYFRIKDSKPQKQDESHKNYILSIVNCGALVIVIVLCVFALFNNPLNSTTDNKPDTQVNSLKQEIQRLTGVLRLKNDTIAELRTQINQAATLHSDAAPLKIDISGNNFNGPGNPLYTNKVYTITIKKANGGGELSNNNGTWKLTNAKLKSGQLTSSKITIQPENDGEVKIEYTPKDVTKYSFVCRSEKAQKPSAGSPSILVTPAVSKVKDGRIYTFTISGYTGNGEWKMDGFDLGSADKKQPKITIKANRSSSSQGKAIISYYKEDGTTRLISKEFEYEE